MGSLLGALALALLTIAFLPSPDRTATAEPTRAPTAPTVVFLGDAVLGPGPPGCVTCEAAGARVGAACVDLERMIGDVRVPEPPLVYPDGYPSRVGATAIASAIVNAAPCEARP